MQRLNEYKPPGTRFTESSRILNAGPENHNEIQAVRAWGGQPAAGPYRGSGPPGRVASTQIR